jgi:alkaline phosphatase D
MRLWKVAGVALAVALLIPMALVGLMVLAVWNGVGAVPFGPALAAGAVALLTPGDPPVPVVTPEPTIVTGRVPANVQASTDPSPELVPIHGPFLVHGVASAGVTPTSAVMWVRTSHASEVLGAVWEEQDSMRQAVASISATTGGDQDYTAIVRLEGLKPDTAYVFRVEARRPIATSFQVTRSGIEGRFRTAPDQAARRDVSFVFSGDLGGGGYCRRPDSGYAIFDAMRELQPDFFIAMGDMIYADNTCPAANPLGEPNIPGGFPSVANRAVDWTSYEQAREVYFQHWRYNRADERFQAFLRATPMYALWDDHEMVNDGGASWEHHNVANASREGYPTLVAAARDAFFAYNPIAREPAEPNRLYRRVRWGADLDLFILDTRSYRSRNDLADSPENQKTMLGPQQLQWLKNELRQSTATWKVVVTSVPLSIPTGGLGVLYGRDAWANGASWDYSSQTGFERELLVLLRSFDEARVQNLVFLSGDVHQAVEIRYATDLDGDGRPLVFHEIVAGPLSAPALRAGPRLDPTLNPTMLYREAGFFNFGHVRIELGADGLAHFIADIRGIDGQPRPGSRLDLTPAR